MNELALREEQIPVFGTIKIPLPSYERKLEEQQHIEAKTKRIFEEVLGQVDIKVLTLDPNRDQLFIEIHLSSGAAFENLERAVCRLALESGLTVSAQTPNYNCLSRKPSLVPVEIEDQILTAQEKAHPWIDRRVTAVEEQKILELVGLKQVSFDQILKAKTDIEQLLHKYELSSLATVTEQNGELHISLDCDPAFLGTRSAFSMIDDLGVISGRNDVQMRVRLSPSRETIFKAITQELGTLSPFAVSDIAANSISLSVQEGADYTKFEPNFTKLAQKFGRQVLIEKRSFTLEDKQILLTPRSDWRGFSEKDLELEFHRIKQAVTESAVKYLSPVDIRRHGNVVQVDLAIDAPKRVVERLAGEFSAVFSDRKLFVNLSCIPSTHRELELSTVARDIHAIAAFYPLHEVDVRCEHGQIVVSAKNEVLDRESAEINDFKELLNAFSIRANCAVWMHWSLGEPEVFSIVDQELKSSSAWQIKRDLERNLLLLSSVDPSVVKDRELVERLSARTGMNVLMRYDPKLENLDRAVLDVKPKCPWRHVPYEEAQDIAKGIASSFPHFLGVSSDDAQVSGNRIVLSADLRDLPVVILDQIRERLERLPLPVTVIQRDKPALSMALIESRAFLVRCLPKGLFLKQLDTSTDSNLTAHIVGVNGSEAFNSSEFEQIRKFFKNRLRTDLAFNMSAIPDELQRKLSLTSPELACAILGSRDEGGVSCDPAEIVKIFNQLEPYPFRLHTDAAVGLEDNSWRIGRRDLTNRYFIRKDPEGTKMFDNAVSIAKLADGRIHLSIAFADFTVIPRWGEVDTFAALRSRSFYSDKLDQPEISLNKRREAIAMMPLSVSSRVGLEEGCDRPAFVLEFYVDLKESKMEFLGVSKAIVKVGNGLTFDEVESCLDSSNDTNLLVSSLKLLNETAQVLRDIRRERGIFNFNVPEFSEEGNDRARRIERECSMLANIQASACLRSEKLPAIWLAQENPDFETRERIIDIGKKARPRAVEPFPDEQKDQFGFRRYLKRLSAAEIDNWSMRLVRQALGSVSETTDASRPNFGVGQNYLSISRAGRDYAALLNQRQLASILDGEPEHSAHELQQTVQNLPEAQERARIEIRELSLLRELKWISDRVGRFSAKVTTVDRDKGEAIVNLQERDNGYSVEALLKLKQGEGWPQVGSELKIKSALRYDPLRGVIVGEGELK